MAKQRGKPRTSDQSSRLQSVCDMWCVTSVASFDKGLGFIGWLPFKSRNKNAAFTFESQQLLVLRALVAMAVYVF